MRLIRGEGFFLLPQAKHMYRESTGDQLELRDIVFLRFRIEINGISYKIKAGDTKPFFIERLIIERVISPSHTPCRSLHSMGKGRHMKKGKRVIARCNGDLVAIGKFIIECAAHIKSRVFDRLLLYTYSVPPFIRDCLKNQFGNLHIPKKFPRRCIFQSVMLLFIKKLCMNGSSLVLYIVAQTVKNLNSFFPISHFF